MFRNKSASWLMLLAVAFAAVSVQALPEDAQQELSILSDSFEGDLKVGVVTYKGNVVLTQGTLKIESDRLVVIRNNNVLEKAVAEGKPAKYQQQINPQQGLTHAEGNRIDYFAVRKEVQITGDARMAQEGNEFSGEKITYDIANEKVMAKSSQTQVGAEKTPRRIKVIIQPDSAPAADGGQ